MAGAPIQIANGIPQLGVQQIPQQLVYQQQIQQPVQQQQNNRKFVPRERFPGEEKCKLFIGGLDYETTNEQLREYFGRFGEIVDSVIMVDKATGKPRGFGFVTFRHLEDVDKLLNSDKPHVILGRNLQVRKYFPKAEFNAEKHKQGQQQQQQQQHQGNNQQQGGGGGGGGGGGMQQSADGVFKGPMRISPDLKIFVGGIAPGTDEGDIRNYFQEFGNIMGVNMPKDHVTKNPRGFAFVGFDNKDIVNTVTKDRYHQINGKTVEVKGCDEQEAYMKKKQGGGNNNYRQHDQQQQIQTVVPAVQTIQTMPQPQQTIQYQLPGQIQQFAQQPQIGAGYTVIPAGYSYDPATGIIYQAALPQQTAIPGAAGLGMIPGAAGLAAAGQLSQIGTIGGLPQQYIQAGQLQGQLQATQASQLQQLQQAGQLQAGQQTVVSAAPSSAYQSIALGQQYSQDPSTFGAQRAVTVQSTIPAQQQLQQLQPTNEPQYQQQPQQSDSHQQDLQRNSQRSFHPYGR